MAAGMVKANHQRPTTKRTRRRGRVDEAFVLERPKRRKMLRIWTKTAAQYPIPTPLDDILDES